MLWALIIDVCATLAEPDASESMNPGGTNEHKNTANEPYGTHLDGIATNSISKGSTMSTIVVS
jgi:hypothetical protein